MADLCKSIVALFSTLSGRLRHDILYQNLSIVEDNLLITTSIFFIICVVEFLLITLQSKPFTYIYTYAKWGGKWFVF